LAAGLSQEELAERAGLSRRGISDLERGARRAPHPATARRLAEALCLSQTEHAAFLVSAHAVIEAETTPQNPTALTVAQPPQVGPPPDLGDQPSFADLLRRGRIEGRLTQEDLALRTGLSVRAISDLERGLHRSPYADTVARLADALGLSGAERVILESAAQRVVNTDRRPDESDVAESGLTHTAPHNLPVQLTTFVGRVQEVSEIRSELITTRLLTLTGPGGVGKTRLALRVAEEELARFEGGVWFVELAPITEPGLVLQTVANLFEVRENPGDSLFSALARILAPRHLLLVLDNCEHLLAACVDLVYRLLRACPKLVVLATSREVLGLAPETIWRVPPLEILDGDALEAPDRMARSEAGALFLERARAVQPGFALSSESAASLDEICRRVDGMPLAIELAASRVRVLGLEQIAGRLASHFRLLASRDPRVEIRQQSLENTIRWSYDLLAPEEQSLFDCLSVFAGGWTLQSMRAVAGGDDDELLDVLERLIDKSLVLTEHVHARTPRYRMLEPLRQFGQERLEERGELGTIRLRHASFFLGVVEQAELDFLDDGPTPGWLNRIDPELDNVRAALRCLITQHDTESAQRLAGGVRPFWFSRGYLAEGRRWLEEALSLDSDLDQLSLGVTESLGTAIGARLVSSIVDNAVRRVAVHAKVILAIGHLAVYQGDLAVSEAALRRSLELYRQLGDKLGVTFSLMLLGYTAELRADFAAARRILNEALALGYEVNRPGTVAPVLSSLAAITSEEGRTSEALSLAQEALRVARDVARGLTTIVCMASGVLGELYYRLGDRETATSVLQEGLARVRETHSRTHFMIPSLVWLGRLAWEQCDTRRARSLLSEALTLGYAMSRYELARGLEATVEVAGADGQPECAIELAGAAAAMRDAMGTPLWPTAAARLEPVVVSARRFMGATAADRAWMQGWNMPADRAFGLALELLRTP
jgi:non-specific serine/threonine protein kinase